MIISIILGLLSSSNKDRKTCIWQSDLVYNDDYEPYNFEEEELEDDDYYFEDDV